MYILIYFLRTLFVDFIYPNLIIALFFFQVSQVYQTISIPKLLELVTFTDIFQLEKVIVEAAKRNNLQVFNLQLLSIKNLFDFLVEFRNALGPFVLKPVI